MNKVEEVAMSICAASGGSWRRPPFNDLHTDALNNRWRHIARAAILAMRIPSEPMIAAGAAADEEMSDSSPEKAVTFIHVAMIDAALVEISR